MRHSPESPPDSPAGTELTASVGSTLFRLEKTGDLPNALGGRDIYGGKVNKGYAEVKLKSVREGRYVDLIAYDVSTDSQETTMDRYRPLARIDVSQNVNIGPGHASGIEVTLDTQQEREYVLAGVKVTFVQLRSSSVTYSLQDLQQSKR